MSKNSKSAGRQRALTRLMAVQIFYQYDFLYREKTLEQIKDDVIENYALDFESDLCSYRDQIIEGFLNDLILGLSLNITNIDEEITEFLKGDWSLDQIDDITRQIVRLGVFELKFMLDVPAKVVIDQYCDITGSFFDKKKVTFVNATLENVAKKVRAKEFATT